MMLKLLFSVLVLANVGLLAYQQGYLASIFPDGREPTRAERQINPGAIRLVAPPVLLASAATGAPGTSNTLTNPATPSPAPTAAAPVQAAVTACTEIGNFDAADALRFEQRLSATAPQLKPVRVSVNENPRNMVLIPPQGSKEAADQKAAELRRRGVTDFFVIQEGEQRWAISLGIFKTEEAAQSHLAALTEKGVRTARLGLFNGNVSRAAFRLRGVDAAGNEALAKVKTEFPKQELRACAAA